jgi:hypothetical protein
MGSAASVDLRMAQLWECGLLSCRLTFRSSDGNLEKTLPPKMVSWRSMCHSCLHHNHRGRQVSRGRLHMQNRRVGRVSPVWPIASVVGSNSAGERRRHSQSYSPAGLVGGMTGSLPHRTESHIPAPAMPSEQGRSQDSRRPLLQGPSFGL